MAGVGDPRIEIRTQQGGVRSPSRRGIRKRSLGTRHVRVHIGQTLAVGVPPGQLDQQQDRQCGAGGEKCGAIGVAAVGKLKGRVKLHQRMIRGSREMPNSGVKG